MKNLLKYIALIISLAYCLVAGYANITYINANFNNLDLSTQETICLSISNNLYCSNNIQTNNINTLITSFKLVRTNISNDFKSTILKSHEHLRNCETIQYLNSYLNIDVGIEEFKIIFPFHNFF